MNYEFEFMEYIENGMILQNIETFEIIFINNIARKSLNLSPNIKDSTSQPYINIDDINNYFIKNNTYINTSISDLFNKIKIDLNTNDASSNIIYFKYSNNISVQVSFDCTWFDKEKSLICIIFQNINESDNTNYDINNINNIKNIKFEEIAEFLPSGVAVMNIDEEMSVQYANSEHYKIMGIDESKKNLQMFLKDIIYEEDKDWVMTDIYHAINNNKDVDIEFRMKTQTNIVKWVRLFGRARKSSNGTILFYSSIKDLSNRREINDKLHLERVLFHKLTEMSDEILFRVDLATNIIHFLGTKFSKIFGFDVSIAENFPECIFEKDKIYSDDLPIFKLMLKSFEDGKIEHIEVRLKIEDELIWHQIQYNFVKSSDNTPLLVVGKLINIQKQKILEEQARIDLLTGFYNKINTMLEVNQLILEQGEQGEFTFFIIDLDHFKSINDNLGHHFGDIVLHDISSDIMNCFRQQDILGRIGGDEFVAIMKDTSSPDDIIKKALQVCNMLEKTFTGKESIYTISASIGISRYPEDGVSYDALYKKADLALYQTKENGKNNFTIYSPNISDKTKQIISKIHTSKRIDGFLVNFTVIATVFNLLYETLDIRLSLNTILEYIGTTYKLDRCYIFETLDNGNIFTNDYQWDRELGFITKDRIQYIDESVLMSIFELADEDGAYFTDDIYEISNQDAIEILEKDNVKSMYIVESLKQKEKKAFFGVENCTTKQVLTDQKQRTLFHVARMIFGALTSFNTIESLYKRIKHLEINKLN